MPIVLKSTAETGYFYTARKNVLKRAEKVEMIKFDPVVQRRVLFLEGKFKKGKTGQKRRR